MNMPHTTPPAMTIPAPGWGLNVKPAQPTWWIWLGIALLLLAGLGGDINWRYAAMAAAALQAVVWLVRNRSLMHFPTQVRVAYALWMAASFLPMLTPLYWIQAAGTTLLVLFGYCPLARLLLFLPANRKVPLTWRRAGLIIAHPPTSGSVLEELKLG